MIRPIALLLLAFSLAACHQYYHSTFPKAPPGCCLVDRLPAGPKHLEQGQSNQGETASADARRGILKLKAQQEILTDPVTGQDMSASVGLFRTGVNYGPDAVFSLSATFQKLEGPLDGMAWSVGVTARDGELDDRYDAKRVSVTLRVRQNGAALNIGEGADKDKPPAANLEPDLYDLIFNQNQPFTLSLIVSRSTGNAIATLTYDGVAKHSLPFKLDNTKLQDIVFTTVGATLTDCCIDGAIMSAELTDFEVRQDLIFPPR